MSPTVVATRCVRHSLAQTGTQLFKSAALDGESKAFPSAVHNQADGPVYVLNTSGNLCDVHVKIQSRRRKFWLCPTHEFISWAHCCSLLPFNIMDFCRMCASKNGLNQMYSNLEMCEVRGQTTQTESVSCRQTFIWIALRVQTGSKSNNCPFYTVLQYIKVWLQRHLGSHRVQNTRWWTRWDERTKL